MIYPKFRSKAVFFLLFCSGLFSVSTKVEAQSTQTVNEIITTYQGYFKSDTTAINSIKPDNSHDLLAFMFHGVLYSTGANDALLTSNGEIFTAQTFKAFPLGSISGSISSNTKLGLSQLYDGVDNGASNPAPVNDIQLYLMDGVNGLDLGTGVANLPKGDFEFPFANINPASIGDGKPDVIITQIADPSAGVDKYEFRDASGQRIGTLQSISYSGIPPVANWTADFYEASTHPATLASNFTKTDRPIRLWAADFSYFGVTAANASSIKNFVIHLNGNSDLAFVAYNSTSITVLSVGIANFGSTISGNDVQLSWQTSTESNSNYFEIESSSDGSHFKKIGIVDAAGNSSSVVNYSFADHDAASGWHYYRLKQFDRDGKFAYSNIINQLVFSEKNKLNVYPNPGVNNVSITYPAFGHEMILNLYNYSGKLVWSKKIARGTTQTDLNVSSYPKGSYILQLSNMSNKGASVKFLIK